MSNDHFADHEDAATRACQAAAQAAGITDEQADNCEDGEHKCPTCPWKRATWLELPEFPQVSDIPPATYWWKDHKDRYTIHLLGDKAGKVIAARGKLRDAILDARAWLDANGHPAPTAEQQEAWRLAQQTKIDREFGRIP